jgi:outer membrane receptor protein involved in Fe transport
VTQGLIGFEGVSGGNLNVRDTMPASQLQETLINPVATQNIFAQGGWEFGGSEAYFEVLGSNRQSSGHSARQFSIDYPFGSPLIPSQLSTSLVPGLNNVGVRVFTDFGASEESNEVDYWRFVGGARGNFLFNGWRYDVAAMHSSSDATYTNIAGRESRLAESLDVITAPVGTDPALVRNGLMCAVTLTDPSRGCIPAPRISTQSIAGVVPDDWRAYVWRPFTGTTAYQETTFSAYIDGPLFELPAGALQAVFGGEMRMVEIDDTPDIDSINADLKDFSVSAPTRGEDNVWEVFAEVEAPLLRNAPLAYDLTLNASMRYTNYDSYGGDTTYKYGGAWSPIEGLTFRGNYGTSFRAPALFEQFAGATSGFANADSDPCDLYGTELDPSTIEYANCDAELGNPAFDSVTGIEIISVGGADNGLAAETSDNLTLGVVYRPSLPAGWGELSLAVDYFDITVNDQVSRVGGLTILNLCYGDPDFRAGGGYCNLVSERDPLDNFSLDVEDSYINIATQASAGYDYNLRWENDIGPGTLRVNALITSFDSQASKLFPDDPLDELNGTLNVPDMVASWDFTYDWGAWRFFYGFDWTDSMQSNTFFGLDPATTTFDFVVPDYYLHNVSVRYSREDEWELTVGVQNLADEDPPTISSGAYSRIGNAPIYNGYDYFGRTFYFNLAARF